MDKCLLTDKNVLVMGLGRFGGGIDAARFACSRGAKVIVTDTASAEELAASIGKLGDCAGVEYHLGSHEAKDFESADVIIANPAVPPDNKFLDISRKAGRFVTSAMNIFFGLCPATIIGITGANGKSTTAALAAHLLRAGLGRRDFPYRKVWLSGNIGNEPLLTIVNQIEPGDLVVLEISSFQIDQLAWEKKAPAFALLTNLTPNHLDRYATFENYCRAKKAIFDLQSGTPEKPAVSIFNGEDEVSHRWYAEYNGRTNRMCLTFSADDVPADVRERFTLPGRANLSNLSAALAVACCLGVDDSLIMECLPRFEALPHRLQFVKEIGGVRWYNDSKATTPQSAIVALDAFERPILIAGGYDKHIPFDGLGRVIAQRAKAAILIGQTAGKIAQAIAAADPGGKVEVRSAATLDHAVRIARSLSQKGDNVVLSPACASYDMFRNFEQRGEQFINLVRQMNC